MNMNIPHFFHTQSRAFLEILKLAETNPNDMDFGKKVRSVINEYKEPKSNCHFEHDQPFIDNTNIEREENDGDHGGL